MHHRPPHPPRKNLYEHDSLRVAFLFINPYEALLSQEKKSKLCGTATNLYFSFRICFVTATSQEKKAQTWGTAHLGLERAH